MSVGVAGLAQADIVAAMISAGEGGEVYFPDGEYLVDTLEATVADQTWLFGRRATLKRSGGITILNIKAPGLRIRSGTFDGNRGINIPTGGVPCGFVAFNYGLDADDITMKSIDGWGMYFEGAGIDFTLRHSAMSDTGLACILWKSTEPRPCGPVIEYNNFDRWIGFESQGVMHLRATAPGALIVNPKVNFNVTRLPVCPNLAAEQGDHANSLGIEIWAASDAIVIGNSTSYGKTGISIGSSYGAKIIGNGVSDAFQYGIEIAHSNQFCIVEGNTVFSVNSMPVGSANPSVGVIMSDNSDGTHVVGNVINGCTYNFGAVTGSDGSVVGYN